MVKHAVEIGWTPLTPEVAKQKRGGDAGMLFRDELATKLTAFNPWLTKSDVNSIIETLDAIPATVEGNRDMLGWLRGERQWYDEAEKRHRRVQLIDFDHPAPRTTRFTSPGNGSSSRPRARATAPT